MLKTLEREAVEGLRGESIFMSDLPPPTEESEGESVGMMLPELPAVKKPSINNQVVSALTQASEKSSNHHRTRNHKFPNTMTRVKYGAGSPDEEAQKKRNRKNSLTGFDEGASSFVNASVNFQSVAVEKLAII